MSPARSTWLRYGGFVGSVGGARVIGAMLTAITFPLILRRLGVEMYGIWSYVIAVLSFLDLLANPGLSSHAAQQVAARRTEATDVVSDSMVLRGLLGVLVVGVIFALAAFEPRVEAARLLRFYGVSITLINLTGSEYLLSSLELFHERSLLMVTQQALYTLGVVLMVRSPADYMWVPGSILLSALPTNLAGWVVLKRIGLQIRPGWHPERWWALMVPSGHYAMATTMSTLYHRTGHLLVRWFLGENALGLYAAAARLVDFVRNLVSIGFVVIAPRVARSGDSPNTLRRLARFSVAGIAVVGLPVMVGILTTAQVLVPLVLGLQYAESARLLPWLAAYVVVAPLAVFFSGTVLYALGRHREYLISTASGAAVAVIANLVLVPLGGIRGASIAFVLGEAVVAVVAYRMVPEAAREVWDSRLLRVAVEGTGLMAVALVAARLLGMPTLAAAIASGALYVLFCGWQSRGRIQAEMQRGNRIGRGLRATVLIGQKQKRLTVAVLLSSGEQFSAFYGGALARWTYEVYRYLTERVQVQVFGFPTAPADRYPMDHQTSAAWRVCRMMQRVPLLRRYEEEVWLRALLGRLRKFDLIHIHNRPQWIPLLRRFGYRGALLLHLQNDHLGHWSAAMLDELAPQLDGVAVCSGYLRDTFAPKSAALAAKTRVVFNGVDPQVFHPREEMRERTTIFFVGRFDREKGVLELVQAFGRVLEDHPDARLVIGGTTGFGTHEETPYVRMVRDETLALESLHPGCVQFPGYLHHDKELPGYFQRATIFASPSLFQEPFGLVNAEAMACGTAVVGSSRGGIPEVLGDAGVLVDPEDSAGFAGALKQVLAHPERRAEMGRTGVSRARETFDWKVIAEQWAALLDDVSAPRSVEISLEGSGGV